MATLLFELRKFLPTLFMPLGISIILVAVGGLRRSRAWTVSGLLLLFLSSLPATSDALGSLLESRYPRLEPTQCHDADAVVVLSGYAGQKHRFPGQLEWYDPVDRFETGMALYRMGKVRVVILTDSYNPADGLPHIGPLVRDAAIQHGVPPEAVAVTQAVRTTADEAAAVKEYLQRANLHRIVLVTSAMHMSRAVLLFRRAGIDLVPFPVDYESDKWQWRWRNFEPSSQALDHTHRAVWEIYGHIFYAIWK
jgi:uncharacterized SAM-binding protein YcdF (DUF218 family)